MRLTDFKVNGFKSFADASAIKIGAELTGIVGPNGCGKSNIIDAIRWTLGESRGSALRVTTTDDYLFGGNTSRPPADWCEVELKFDNSAQIGGGMWAKYSEIVVRREYTRDERQQYSINGTVVRRRDVLDLFRGTGLSPRAYGVVEQGMVAHIAESSPEELRTFIEESAHISQYKARRHETMNRLQGARDNLAQVDLILEGLAKNERALKRQARVAKQYREAASAQQQLKCQIAIVQQQQTQAQLRANQTEIDQLQTRIKNEHAADAEDKTQLAAQQKMLTAAAAKTEQLIREQSVIGTRIAEINKELEGAEQRQQLVDTQRADYQQTLAELAQNISDAEARIAKLKTQAQTAQEQMRTHQSTATSAQTQWQRQQARAAETQQQLAAAQAKVAEAEKANEALTVRHELYAEQQKTLAQRIAQVEKSLAQIAVDDTPLPDLAEDEARTAAAERAVAAAEQEAAEHEAALQQQEQTIRSLANDIANLQKEIKLANDILQDHDAAAEEHYQHHQRVAQRLALQEQKWATTLDAVLGVYARAIVVDDLADYLQTHNPPHEGHAVVLWRASGSDTANRDIGLPLLLSALALSDDDSRIMQNWLAGVYLAEDNSAAIAARPQLQFGESIVTPDGVVYQSHAVFKHRRTQGGFDWQKKVNELQASAATAQQQHDQTSTAYAAAQQQHAQRQDDIANQKQALAVQQQQLVDKKIEQSRQEERQQSMRLRKQELEQTRQHLHTEQQQITAQQQAIAGEAQAGETAFAASEAQLQTARHAVDAAEQQLAANQQAMQDAQQQASNAQQQHTQLDYETTTVQKQISEMQSNHAATSEKLAKGEATRQQVDIAALTQERDDKQKSHTQYDADIAASRAAQQQAQTAVDAHQQSREQRQATITGLQKQLSEHQISEREWTLTATRYDDEIQQYGFDAEQVQAWRDEAQNNTTPADTLLAQWQEQLKTVEEKQESFGAINFAAEQDLGDCQEQMGEIQQQKDDITTAIDELTTTIGEIDRETKGRLESIYTQINDIFSTLFRRLFNGGEGHLVMVGDDILEAGFELKARPPGKRMLPIRTLSGGEKSIAALAFIFAMMKINPPPFCLLDEVDAALDDSRTDRFIELLQEMSDSVQCMVITHNKSTISAMKRLIGITQEELGVSKIVTVTLEDALRAV